MKKRSPKPLVTVYILAYNYEKFIDKAIKSVFSQTYKNWELIIINDGSTDKSPDIINGILDRRICVFSNENKGLSFSRNFGIKNSKANYIAFLDADDLWCEDYLITIYNLIKFNNSSKIFSTATKILRQKKRANLSAKTFNTKEVKVISNYFSLKKNIFNPSSLVVEKSVFKKVGYFNDKVNYGEDEDFFIRCFSLYNLTYYKSYKVYYLKGVENQLTSPNSNINRVIPDYSVYLNNENQHLLKPYIDFIYFKLVLLYKMERNYDLVKFYKQKISTKNLDLIQKIKFYLPSSLFYYIKSLYLILIK